MQGLADQSFAIWGGGLGGREMALWAFEKAPISAIILTITYEMNRNETPTFRAKRGKPTMLTRTASLNAFDAIARAQRKGRRK
jgi:hypothetical protein